MHRFLGARDSGGRLKASAISVRPCPGDGHVALRRDPREGAVARYLEEPAGRDGAGGPIERSVRCIRRGAPGEDVDNDEVLRVRRIVEDKHVERRSEARRAGEYALEPEGIERSGAERGGDIDGVDTDAGLYADG